MSKFPWHFVKFPDNSLALRNVTSSWHFPNGYEPYWERRRGDSLILATVRDDTWNMPNMQHITPNWKIWDYSGIPVWVTNRWKKPAHLDEGDHHLRKRPQLLTRGHMSGSFRNINVVTVDFYPARVTGLWSSLLGSIYVSTCLFRVVLLIRPTVIQSGLVAEHQNSSKILAADIQVVFQLKLWDTVFYICCAVCGSFQFWAVFKRDSFVLFMLKHFPNPSSIHIQIIP